MLKLIPTGSTLLDQVLGGGYPIGRLVHVYGDPSTGKTQLAIEAMANFYKHYPEGEMRYCDAEAAFDEAYAYRLGLPTEKVSFCEPQDAKLGLVLEDFDRQLDQLVADAEATGVDWYPSLYILDSMDALPTTDEASKPIDKRGGYGTEKAKMIGEILRTKVQKLERLNICLFVISQLREKIGVTFGPTKTIAGGKALLFYRSQAINLAKIETLKKTVSNIESAYGVRIRARCEKNKVGAPFRECEYDIIFDYGIDDETSCIEFLAKANKLKQLPDELVLKEKGDGKKKKDVYFTTIKEVCAKYNAIEDKKEKRKMASTIRATTITVYQDIQNRLAAGLPSGKYEADNE